MSEMSERDGTSDFELAKSELVERLRRVNADPKGEFRLADIFLISEERGDEIIHELANIDAGTVKYTELFEHGFELAENTAELTYIAFLLGMRFSLARNVVSLFLREMGGGQ
ncbi:MAG: hypothetical protein JRD89_05090 [Deltaproteobacteria bacterium]|nr:hypothetical protein [Deltaproteobacteria bacterium]